MKLKYEMEFVDVGDEKMAVPLDSTDSFRGVLRMNGTTERILTLLQTDTDEDTIVSALSAQYDATEETVRRSVRKVLAILRGENLLEE